jgi:phosphoglycolate phosphatase-like HAD superfamily hydrolase
VTARRRLLLFDIDGTMLSCRGRGLRAMHRAVQVVFGVAPREADIRAFGKTDPMLFEEVGAVYGLDAVRVAARRSARESAYVERLAADLEGPSACEPKAGIEPLLASLALRDDVVLGLVTGNLEAAAWLKLRSAGLERFFAGGAFGSDGRARADLVALAMKRLAVAAEPFPAGSVWVVGDTPADVEGGRAHGTRTLAVATGGFARAELVAAGATCVVDDFGDTAAVVDILCARA